MINVGLIGFGYWGPNLLRNFKNTPNCNVLGVLDLSSIKRKLINELYPDLIIFENYDEMLKNKDLDAVVIATPVSTHYEIAKKALNTGRHVFVEKPLTSNIINAKELIEIAIKNNLILMVDHTFLYTGAVQNIKQNIDNGVLGTLNYFDSTRINLGLFQKDVNVLWDLAPHDLSILFYLSNERPASINATGYSHTKNGIENIAFLTLNYESNFVAHINCSWSSPVKVRSTLIGGSKKMILYNDIEPSEKVKIYDTGIDIDHEISKEEILIQYRTGDIMIPKLSGQEALSNAAFDFIKCVLQNSEPISNYKIGLDVVKVLEASEKSLKRSGEKIEII